MDSAEKYDRVQYDYQTPDGKELIEHLSLEKYEECSVLDLGCGSYRCFVVLSLVARSRRKRGNRQTEGQTDTLTN